MTSYMYIPKFAKSSDQRTKVQWSQSGDYRCQILVFLTLCVFWRIYAFCIVWIVNIYQPLLMLGASGSLTFISVCESSALPLDWMLLISPRVMQLIRQDLFQTITQIPYITVKTLLNHSIMYIIKLLRNNRIGHEQNDGDYSKQELL